MNCELCGKKVVLVPSAKQRAEKFGGQPKDYEKLFPTHTECQLKRNRERVSELIKGN